MTHWLDAVRDATRRLAATGEPATALIFGDAAGRATAMCRAAGMEVVRAIRNGADRGVAAAGDAAVTHRHVPNEHLPFADASFDLVVLQATLEFVHDDRLLVRECGRVLRPGGRLVTSVPAAGPLAGIDGINLYRYTRELTGRGGIPSEALPVGWRRHYGADDIESVFHGVPVIDMQIVRAGWALAESPLLAGMLVSRTLATLPHFGDRVRSWYERFGDLDQRLPGPAMVLITAARS